jgi:sugar/nucleoside kinase (ribokinase family)
LGGAVTYVPLVARRLWATASVVSRVGSDFPESYVEWLKQEGIDLSGLVRTESDRTTRFELKYQNDFSDRALRLKSRASPLNLSDIPQSLFAKVIHLAPIAGEVSFELSTLLRERGEVLSLDAQGILRSFDSFGNIRLSHEVDKRMLELVDVCKCSLDEIQVLGGKSDLQSNIKTIHRYGVEVVVVTMGAKGALLSTRDTIFEIPPFNSERVVYPTGAGDVFIGGFLTELSRSTDPFWCACVGSAAASIVVEAVGPTFNGDKEEIYRRAKIVSER